MSMNEGKLISAIREKIKEAEIEAEAHPHECRIVYRMIGEMSALETLLKEIEDGNYWWMINEPE